MTTIRAAAAEDAPTLAELRWEFRAAQDPPVESHDEFVQRCSAWIARQLTAGGSWRAWVAVRTGRIVGQVWMNVIEKIPNPAPERERHAYVSNLFVTPSERGGVGTQLLETTLAWAAANDVDRVFLWPSRRSVSLYHRHGFARDAGAMELIVPARENPPRLTR